LPLPLAARTASAGLITDAFETITGDRENPLD
jgi:hypothetical protein